MKNIHDTELVSIKILETLIKKEQKVQKQNSKYLTYNLLFIVFLILIRSTSLANILDFDSIAFHKKWTFQNWNANNGLPQNTVFDIVQDENKILWFATQGGIVEFDGNVIKVHNPDTDSNIKCNRFTKLHINQNNELFAFSSEGYVVCRRKKEFKSIYYPNKNIEMQGAFSTENGDLFVLFKDSIYLLKNETFTSICVSPKNVLNTVLYNPSDNVAYVSTTNGLYAFDSKNCFTSIEGFSSNVILGMALKNDSVLVRSFSKMGYVRNKKVIRYTHKWDETTTGRYFIDSHGYTWKGTHKGVYIYDGSKVDSINTSYGLSSNYVTCIYEDHEKNVWIGSQTNGINKLSRKLFHVISSQDGLLSQQINPVLYHNKTLYVGNNCGGTNIIRGNYIEKIKNHNVIEFGDDIDGKGVCVTTYYFDDADTSLWIGCYTQGVSKLKNGKVYHFDKSKGINNTDIHCILKDNSNRIWVGSDRGVNTINTLTFEVEDVSEKYSIPKTRVLQFYLDSKNAMWIGTSIGLFIVKENKTEYYNAENKLPINHIRSFYEDENGDMWIGSYGGGLIHYRDGNFTIINSNRGLYDNIVSAIIPDKDIIWMTCNRGFYGVRKSDLLNAISDPKHRISCLFFGMESGLLSNEFNGGFQPSWTKDEKGVIYLPTFNGVAVFDPSKKPVFQSPKIGVRSIYTEKGKIKNENLVFENNFARITFDVFCANFHLQSNIKKEYRLIGLESDWLPINKDFRIEFTKLAAGDYILELRTVSLLGENEAYVIQIPFTVKAPWYLSPSTLLLVLLGVLCLVFIVLLGLRAQSIRRKKLFEEALEKRTSELRKSERNLSTIIENSDELIFLTNQSLTILAVNNKLLASEFVRSHQKEDVLQHKLQDVVSPKFESHFKEVLKQFEIDKSTDYTLEHIEKNQKFYYQIQIQPILDDKSKLYGIVGFIRDITKSKQHEQQLYEAQLKAEDAAQTKANFLTTMSHEIRTPLNGVIGMTSLLFNTPLNTEQKYYTETIKLSSETLMSIINSILDFSKAEANMIELEVLPFSLDRTINETLSLLSQKIDEKNIEIVRTIDIDTPGILLGDVTRLRQILINIINNAIKFTPANGRIEVHTQVVQYNYKDIEILISIKDSGIGIDDDKISTLFTPFNQLHSSTNRKYGGTGLGLAISKKLVTLMGGEISVRNNKNEKGCTFSFNIKLKKKDLNIINVNSSEKINPKIKSIAIVIPDSIHNTELHELLIDHGILRVETIRMSDETKLFEKRKDFDFCLSFNYYTASSIQNLNDKDSNIIYIKDSYTVEKQRFDSKIFTVHNMDLDFSKLVERINQVSGSANTKAILVHKSIDTLDTKILVVEDNLVNQKLAQLLLDRLGYKCDISNNGLEAIEALKSKNYHLIFMDVQMPEMDGLEATRHIRNNFALAEQPIIIAMTANALKGDREICLEAGMNDYITKPIDLVIIQKTIEKWLKNNTII